MTSEQKIKEARFFFEKISEYYHDEEKCEYCLSAFLGAGFSLFDHTLEEYNEEFKLKIPRLELKIKSFYERAKAAENEKAVGFIRLYASEYLKIVRNPISASMLTLRNINTHDSTNLTPSGTFLGEDTVDELYFLGEIEKFLPTFKAELFGWLESKKYIVSMKNQLQLEVNTLTESEMNALYLSAVETLTQTSVKDVCEQYLILQQVFINAIRAKYPRW